MDCTMFKDGMRPVHPGKILLEDDIEPMGVSVRAVAIALYVPYSHLSEITKDERA
jgi:plasmid maintenance system antidote protein VapI